MDIFQQISEDIKLASQKLLIKNINWNSCVLEFPKDPLNGDIYSNIALVIGPLNNQNAREVAFLFKNELQKLDYIAHIEIAGEGFINFTIKASHWQKYLNYILNDEKNFWFPNIGNGKKINIEYVSANPTGPLHIGHTRGAIYGDILSKIFSLAGYNVTREYYINDGGSQIENLVNTVFLRCKEILSGLPVKIKDNMYPGEYLKEIAQRLVVKYKEDLLMEEEISIKSKVQEFSVKHIMSLIKEDLTLLDIQYDVFTSEQKLHNEGKVEKAIAIIKDKGFLYKGKIPLPKGKTTQNLTQREQLLFKSSKFGDSQDRPIQKQDGQWTYLASDIAYAKDKIDRGFDTLIYILGADHKGYIDRINAIVKVLGSNKVNSIVKTTELVNFVQDSILLKMSKRKGNMIQVQEIIDKVGLNVLRFMMVSRRNDMEIDFDFQKVIEQSKENPVFYVQYAYVRIISIIKKVKNNQPEALKIFQEKQFDLSLLSNEEEIRVIKLLTYWPKLIASSLKSLEPNRITNYLIEVSSRFHSLWNLGKADNNYLFIVPDNPQTTAARLAFAISIQKIIERCFDIIGVTPMKEM